ncbi:MAG: bifunctional 4-hydroxy-2-oxoglutarate aldolase/2-dehydro-3-deoxy-phosphogluconate aldolase [Streptosporangiaceae bacterium]|nr:bifunctional 4-hydroxy-2-oxoglutarate aldolase/2-dehydro-3-deoxy-phosphogluconate aldolase [Streptosporangiaceae bacterium]
MNLLDALRSRRLLAIVRGTDPGAATRTVLTLAEEGVSLIEVSLNTPDALGVISRARAELGPAAWVGAGTVVTPEDADGAADAGADFVVTPAITPGLRTAAGRGLPLLAGALTPTEIETAMRQGAAAVKLFPASLGGVRYLRALLDPFPEAPLVPVGGVDAGMAHEYLAAGAVAVGVGSPLVGDAASRGSLSDLRARARSFLAAVRAADDDTDSGADDDTDGGADGGTDGGASAPWGQR